MSDEREFNSFVESTHAEIRDRATGGGDGATPDFKENVFTEWILEAFEENGITSGSQVVFYEGRAGRGLIKVNGYAISDEGDAVDIFTTVYHGSTETLQKNEVSKIAGQAARFFEAVLQGHHERMEASSDAAAMARHIHDAAPRLKECRIFILTDGVTTVKKANAMEVKGRDVRFDVWDMQRLFRSMQAGLARDEIVVDLEKDHGGAVPCVPMPREASDYMAYLAIIPGELLYKLYDTYGSRLLEFNVRSFLSARGKINKGIRTTLKEEPDRFMAYNNGIVVTADEMETSKLPDGQPAIKRMKGLQIVNGGQTTASIHRARKVDKTDISSVFVPAKITVISPEAQEEVVRQVSRYANTQNVIQMADFSANEPFHVEIERLSERIWCPGEEGRWFYERARGQYQVAKANAGNTPAQKRRFNERTPTSRKFTKTDLAKFENSWRQKPHVVSMGAQKNFNLFMQELRQNRPSDWVPDEDFYKNLIAKAILFKATQKIVRQEKFSAYRANIVTYLMAYVVARSGNQLDLDALWQNQEISSELESLLRQWSHDIRDKMVESAGEKNVTEWCKKEACWKTISALDLKLPDPLPPEFKNRATSAPGSATTRDGSVTAEDLDNISICKKVDGESWFRIHAWGKQTGMLEKWQAGIAHTLSSYAANGWERNPSPKQAKQGAKILKIAQENGFSLTGADDLVS